MRKWLAAALAVAGIAVAHHLAAVPASIAFALVACGYASRMVERPDA
jgi:hypothetical protein